MPPDDIPDYLPDGSINIHGKLASKLHISVSQSKRGKTKVDVFSDALSTEAMLSQMNEEMDSAYLGQ